MLPMLGFVSDIGPIAEWGLTLEKDEIVVNQLMETGRAGIWAAGDVTTYPGKLKLIACGFGEAATAVNQAVHWIYPEKKVAPGHSQQHGDLRPEGRLIRIARPRSAPRVPPGVDGAHECDHAGGREARRAARMLRDAPRGGVGVRVAEWVGSRLLHRLRADALAHAAGERRRRRRAG